MLICFGVGGCCKLLSCLKFARLTKASVLVSFDGCDDECVLGFVLDSVSPRFTVFVGTSSGSFIGTASILDRPRNQIMPLT